MIHVFNKIAELNLENLNIAKYKHFQVEFYTQLTRRSRIAFILVAELVVL